MKVAESLLAALVVTLAAFVATQATSRDRIDGTEAAGTLGAAERRPAERGGPVERGSADRPAAALTPRPAEEHASALATGRAEGRLAARYVLDVPRAAAWPARDVRRRLAQGEAGTYIGAVLDARDSMITRWPDRLVTPLRVWVGDGGLHDGWDPRFPSVVREAFEEWATTGIPVHFTYVRDSAGADVRVRFVPQFPQGISGRTIWSRDSAWWLVAGDIELAILHPMGGAVSMAQLHAIALHEIGHLLGLDHVDDPSHIMAPRVRVRALSDADRATMQLLYSVPAGSARD